ncbi:hypothetical protein [Arthrobacter sp. HLT1-21]
MLIGCHALVWTCSQDGPSIENSIRRTAKADFDTTSTKKSLAGHGLTATASLELTAATDLSSEDDVVAAGEALLGRCLEIVHELESSHLRGVIYSAMKNLWTASAGLGAHANRYIRDRLMAVRSIKPH